jgi:hypothetical protein
LPFLPNERKPLLHVLKKSQEQYTFQEFMGSWSTVTVDSCEQKPQIVFVCSMFGVCLTSSTSLFMPRFRKFLVGIATV